MFDLFAGFVLIALVSFAVAYFYTQPRVANKGVVRRLNIIHRPANSADVELIELAQKNRNFAETVSDLFAHYKFSTHISTLVLHAGRADSVGFLLLVSLGCACGAFLLCWFFSGVPGPSALAALAGALLPYLWLRRLSSKRLKKFTEALPDAIDLMARALRAGHSSGSSIEIIAEQSPAPLSEEFGRCFQRQKFGIPFRDALLELGDRVPSKDLHFLITAILVQKETGGDLTQILDRATEVIRERVRIEGEVKSYTAQGRLTGWILSLLPLAMMGLINVMTPGYTHILFVDPLGQKMLYAALGFIAMGAFVIRKIVDIKV
ncbi:MAG: type II secretion system F family protein [Janthinobacterium lividum]